MEHKEFSVTSSNKSGALHVYVWEPETAPAGVMQIIRDDGEHALRYETFAQFMAQNGWVVCSYETQGRVDEKTGYKVLTKDAFKLFNILKDKYAELPFVLFGHGAGSLIARYACSLWGVDFCGAVFWESAKKAHKRLGIVVNHYSWAKRMPKSLPVLFLAGQNEPAKVGANIITASKRLNAAGCECVDVKLYSGTKHGILFETTGAEPCVDILKWANGKIYK